VIIYGNALLSIMTTNQISETAGGGRESERERERVWIKEGVSERHSIHSILQGSIKLHDVIGC
jgi:hypothetical protein